MSLKKQIKELKSDLLKNSEKLERLKRNAKIGKLEEMEAEVEMYKSELSRVRQMIKLNITSVDKDPEAQESMMILEPKTQELSCNDDLTGNLTGIT